MNINEIINLRARLEDAHTGNTVRTILVHTGTPVAFVAFKKSDGWLVFERVEMWKWERVGVFGYTELVGLVVLAAYEYDEFQIEMFKNFRGDWKRRLGGA